MKSSLNICRPAIAILSKLLETKDICWIVLNENELIPTLCLHLRSSDYSTQVYALGLVNRLWGQSLQNRKSKSESFDKLLELKETIIQQLSCVSGQEWTASVIDFIANYTNWLKTMSECPIDLTNDTHKILINSVWDKLDNSRHCFFVLGFKVRCSSYFSKYYTVLYRSNRFCSHKISPKKCRVSVCWV